MALPLFQKKLAENVDFALQQLNIPSPGTSTLQSWITIPPSVEKGNLSIPVFRFTPKGESPVSFAQKLAEKLPHNETFERWESAGPYVNAFISPAAFNGAILEDALKVPALPAQDAPLVMVEYASPNTNKPLHLGHVRNIALAQSIIRLFFHEGNRVLKVQVVNDRGVHICKALLAYQKWGDGKTPESEKMKPDHFVGKYYNEFSKRAEEDPKLEEEAQQMLQKWENNDPEIRKLWEKMNGWVEKGWAETFAQLGAEFDVNYYESEFYNKGKEVVMQAYEKGLFEKAENGAIIVPLKKFNLPDKPVMRGDGTSLYFTQDVYLAMRRLKEYPDLQRIIHIVGNEQEMHFRQLFATLELLGVAGVQKFHHLGYGLVVLPSGKMSSRQGTVVNADDLIAELKEIAQREYDTRNPELDKVETARRASIIALAALKFHMVKQDAKKDIVFDPKESLSFEGQTGPYLLYTNARLQSVLRKSYQKPKRENAKLLTESREKELLALLGRKNEIISSGLSHYSPHVLSHYLLELANTFNTYYHETKIIQENAELEQARLTLVQTIHAVLEEGLYLLGIETLKEM